MAAQLRLAGLTEAPPSEDVQDLVDQFVAAKQAVVQAERHLAQVQAKLTEKMAEEHRKSISLISPQENLIRTVTFVQSETYKIDEKGLRKALTAKVFDKYTDKKLNRKALEEAMSRGEVDPMKVSRFVSATKGTPYLRYTEKDAVDE